LKLLLPVARGWLEVSPLPPFPETEGDVKPLSATPSGEIIALIKPQFEAGRQQVGKGGIVKDPAVHRQVLAEVLSWAQANQLGPAGLMRSPIKGAEGNVEFLVWLRPGSLHAFELEQAIQAALE